MFKHSLLLAFRDIKKFESSFFINLIGLSTGLACALMIYLRVIDELNFERFHEKDSRLFQVMERQPLADDILIKEMMAGVVGFWSGGSGSFTDRCLHRQLPGSKSRGYQSGEELKNRIGL